MQSQIWFTVLHFQDTCDPRIYFTEVTVHKKFFQHHIIKKKDRFDVQEKQCLMYVWYVCAKT